MPQNVGDLIDLIRATPVDPAGTGRLATMLRQDAAHFEGLSPGEADQVRGHIFAAFEHRDLPKSAFEALKEELRTSQSPTVLAGAARASRGVLQSDPEIQDLLAAALARIEVRDEIVQFEASDRSHLDGQRTARDEIAASLSSATSPVSACCGTTGQSRLKEQSEAFTLCKSGLGRIIVEDQTERRQPLVELLRERTSLVAFFYTRCMNPAKCSLTISRLADVARLAAADPSRADIGVFAISYDPDYDHASRLRAFGHDRRFPFSEHARLLRCDEGWDRTRRMFDLQVGYSAATVNAHARELFIVTDRLQATAASCERLSEPARLLAELSDPT